MHFQLHLPFSSNTLSPLGCFTILGVVANGVRLFQWIGGARGSLSAPLCLHFDKPLPQCCFFLLPRRKHIGRVGRAVSPVEVLVVSAIFDGDCYDCGIARNVLHNAAR